MALRRRVIEGDDILSELYADTFLDVSDEECESESVNSDVVQLMRLSSRDLVL
jgi:hypothetical protein